MGDDYTRLWTYRLKWLYTLLVVFTLMLPVFYVIYISFNQNGFGARDYVFTLEWYGDIFSDLLLMNALGNTMLLAAITMLAAVPLGLIAASFYKATEAKLLTVTLLLSPLFVPADILGSALLVFFKNLNIACATVGEWLGISWFDTWFELGYFSALVGLIIYTIPYIFVVILITMGRYKEQQSEAARSCGATAWQAFYQVEFPQIRAGVFSACAFTLILTFNEYTRTSLLKGGYDTITSVLISQMLNEGMSEQSYAMSSLISFIAIAVIGSIILYTLVHTDRLDREARAKAQPLMST
ncbi:MAG: ABC transporter permease subunit [Rhodospirillaceae bacterium]|jgi:spermidine/putrescine transport system permease protein|nr:ABC transporter permease subunit [Rhodospirillaceae bacterium]MBT4044336.1 ABC transporter permease subunit [Rhodospirillaceae bacterium]MBT4689259.1 ABC transporter permease subunit [Rhodospirillaceae bacterium]MBT5079332.1 ABC transporter permease subunit [Rhodospirillaceae bacterium]MBT5525808.1 ABC transporter permease subunit [Rhodospirillaceae bacterium]